MNIKSEYLAAYLPYVLKFYHKRLDSEPTNILTMDTLQINTDDIDIHFKEDCWLSDLIPNISVNGFNCWVKPILKPMKFNPKNTEWERIIFKEWTDSQYDYRYLCVNTLIELISNHYDVFGLIDDEEAISYEVIN